MNKPGGKKDLSRGSMLALLGLQAMVFALIGGLLWAWTGRPLHELVTPDFHQLGLGVALAAALVATALAGFRIFPDLAEKLCRLQASNFPFLRDGLPFPAIVWISICAGIGEEILFRGGLQTLAIDHVGPIAGITLSSMVFCSGTFRQPIDRYIPFWNKLDIRGGVLADRKLERRYGRASIIRCFRARLSSAPVASDRRFRRMRCPMIDRDAVGLPPRRRDPDERK